MPDIKKNRISSSIYDVATLAGVSRGTVDRVIHNRGRFSENTKRKVLEAIRTLDYSPNTNASNLASKKHYDLAYLIPENKADEYWWYIEQGLKSAGAEIEKRNVAVHAFHYDYNSLDSFIEASLRVLESAPDGLIMSATYHDAVKTFSEKLADSKIPYAFIDNRMDELDYLFYIGVDNFRNGELGAFLLSHNQNPESIAIIRLDRGDRGHPDPNVYRRHGIESYIYHHYPQCRIYTVMISPSSAEKTTEAMNNFTEEHPEVRHLIVTSSRVFLLSDWLRTHPRQDRVVIGYDDLRKNLNALSEGLIECLITRDIHSLAEKTIFLFADFLCDGKRPQLRNFVKMNILYKNNM